MRKWLASMLTAAGLGQAEAAGEKIQHVDPNSILYSVPTISNDLAPLDPIVDSPQPEAAQMHEDDWCQVEFFPESSLSEMQRILTEYKAFEISNRQMTTIKGEQYPVWRNTYVRKVTRKPLLSGDFPAEQLARIVGGEIGPPPALFSSRSWSGRVKNGFTIRVGKNIDLYGYTAGEGIPVLAASVGANPDDQALVVAFSKLNTALGFILVDWKSQFILLGTNPDGTVQAWQP